MQIVDLHTHTYPRPEIGRQALQGEGWSPYAGTVPELREAMTRGGIATSRDANVFVCSGVARRLAEWKCFTHSR